MDEEEVQQPKQKINLDSFFNRLDTVEEVANNGLKQSTLNVNAIKANKTLIESISVSIEAMRTEIREIANYIVIEKKFEKDAAEDRRFEAEDKEQKQKMDERLKALLPEKKQTVESPPEEEKKGGGLGGFMSGLLKVIGGLGLIAGLAALVTVALPVLGPILLGALGIGLTALVFTKLGPPLVKWVKGMFNKIKNFLSNVFKPVEKIPVVGKPLKGLTGTIVGGIGGVGNAVANALSGALKAREGGSGDGGNGTVTSDSNMSLESENGIEKKLEKTLEKQNLLEKETKSESNNINFKSEFKEGNYEFSSSEKDGVTSTSSKFEGQARFDLETGKAYILGEEVTHEGYNEYINLPEKERLSKDGMMRIIEKYAVTKIEPESNNNKKELIQSFSKNSNAISTVIANELTDISRQKDISSQIKNNQVPNNAPQVSSAEIKGTGTTVSYVRALSNQYLSIANNKFPPEVARMIQ